MNTIAIKNYLLTLQEKICHQLAAEEPTAKFFHSDTWQHAQGGGGDTRVLSDGDVIEKAGVNFSHIEGGQLPEALLQKQPDLRAYSHYQVMGISVIIHPRNPYAATTHFNVRFFQAEGEGKTPYWWFGGGFDLTPYYGFTEDCVHWHQMAKNACDPFDAQLYSELKKNCDDYFFLKHRNEPRGIGGLFFDYFNRWPIEKCFAFMQSVGEHFLLAYIPILNKRKNHPYAERQRDFQCYRRGRYVEFNLLYDRGTAFGLQSGGRTESILVSLPPQVLWRYNWQPAPESEEAKLYRDFLVLKEWI
jgi:coproporphyrinogen III oxidase